MFLFSLMIFTVPSLSICFLLLKFSNAHCDFKIVFFFLFFPTHFDKYLPCLQLRVFQLFLQWCVEQIYRVGILLRDSCTNFFLKPDQVIFNPSNPLRWRIRHFLAGWSRPMNLLFDGSGITNAQSGLFPYLLGKKGKIIRPKYSWPGTENNARAMFLTSPSLCGF